MGKRSNFRKRAQDYYPTPFKALQPLIPHLKEYNSFVEPCAGDGRLIRHIKNQTLMTCAFASDIDPKHTHIHKGDALHLDEELTRGDVIITNPPWTRTKESGYLMHSLIVHFSKRRPTWLLFDADWMHTQQSKPFMQYCHKIVSVGRVSWMENGKSGKDNCAWYLFDANVEKKDTVFFGR